MEYLAVRARRAERGLQVIGGRGSGAVILLAGPPGVGKTSLGESVARAMGRKFVRVALGGIRDEAEIRGHRRTYVGALPGRIVRAIKEAGSMNPVVLLDEVDKIGADYRGDPAAALLEVLDPAQNHTFRDHYLELDLDLSDVLFIATANVVEQIPSALLDRMELVTLDGYTEDDKVAIARDFLLPRQLERAALTADEVSISDAALRELAANYTREAGVRQMERLLAKALRKAATKLATGEVERVDVDEPDLKELLGRPRFTPESAERTSVPGVATGLAVTGLGGDVLFIEASAHDGPTRAGLTLTGQLGDVMKESAQIALSFVKAHAAELGIDPAFFDRAIHVHVPAGAVPKDGPSAGVTMVTALTSLATGRPVRSEVGMTGEVTLNGRVLPIGGVKQKLLAAQRAGLTEVFLPLRNEPDLDDVPAEVREALTVHIVGDVLDVVRGALDAGRTPRPWPPDPAPGSAPRLSPGGLQARLRAQSRCSSSSDGDTRRHELPYLRRMSGFSMRYQLKAASGTETASVSSSTVPNAAEGSLKSQLVGDREVPEVEPVGDQAEPDQQRVAQHPTAHPQVGVAEDRQAPAAGRLAPMCPMCRMT